MAGDQGAGKSTERLEGKGAGEGSLDASDVQESRAAGKKTILEIGKTNPDNWQSKEGHFALIDGSADGQIMASRDVGGEVSDKPEDSKNFTSQLAAVTEQGDSEKATVAKNLVDMRNNAKQRGLPTTEIDKFAKEALLDPKGGIQHSESDHDAGTFKAINPRNTLIAQDDRTSESAASGRASDASEIVADCIATGWKGLEHSFNPIQRDISGEARYKLQPDDTYESIAMAQLGSNATESELETYMKESHEINGFPGEPSPFRSPTTDFVRLPGHNRQGDLILEGSDGSSISIESDGSKLFSDKDGTSSLVKKTSNGGVLEEHKGTFPEDNYTIFVTVDGIALEQGADGKWSSIENAEADYRVQELRLTDAALEKMPIRELQDLRSDSKRLHKRFGEFLEGWMTKEDLAQPDLVKQNKRVASQEVARTLRVAADTLKAPSDALPVDHDLANRSWRGKLISQAIHHATYPASIDQGSQAVCGITALEARTYTRNPSAALKLVSDVALTGKFELNYPPRNSVILNRVGDPTLFPDAEAEPYEIDKGDSSRRSYASQIFESAAINIGLQNRENPKHVFVNTVNPTEYGDNQRYNRRGYYVPTSAELRDRSQYINLKEANSDSSTVGISEVEVIGIYRQVTGKEESYFYVVAGQGNSNARLKEDGTAMLWKAEELPIILLKLKQLNLFPAIASVDSSVSPIIDQWRASGLSGTPTGRHAISIPEVSESGTRLAIDNFWGSRADNTKLDKITGELPIQSYQLGRCILSNSMVSVDSSQKPDERPGAVPKNMMPCDWRTYYQD